MSDYAHSIMRERLLDDAQEEILAHVSYLGTQWMIEVADDIGDVDYPSGLRFDPVTGDVI